MAAAVGAQALTAGCGGTEHDEQELGGSSSLAFEVSPGVTVTTATYRVVGPNGFTSAGSVAVGTTADVSVSLSGLPVGTGYNIDLASTASDGVTKCNGSTAFQVSDVSASPVSVIVHLFCGVPQGTVQVNAALNLCPTLDALDVAPLEAKVGGRMFLTAAAHDSDNGPAPLAYRWRANGGLLGGATQPNLTFFCTSVGNVDMAVSATDGDAACDDVLTATLTCSAP